AYAAARVSTDCAMDHSSNAERRVSTGTLGENLAQWSGDVNGVPAFQRHVEALRMYTEECSDMFDLMGGNPLGPISRDPTVFAKYGHLTQLLWRTSTTVGCGFCEVNGVQLSVCHYGPQGGNTVGQNFNAQ
ncbi:hypothetical protein HDU96_001345, partial [Phlyctochytrium bullatum]